MVFCDGDSELIDATIDRTTFDGLYASDHHPVTATLRLVPELTVAFFLVFAGFDRLKQRRRQLSERVVTICCKLRPQAD